MELKPKLKPAKKPRKYLALKIILGIMLVVFLSIGGICLYKIAHDNGRAEVLSEKGENLTAVGKAVAEKANETKKLAENLAVTEPLDTDGIENYLAGLSKIISETENAEAKKLLEEYFAKWESFKTVYASEDNEKIQAEFAGLKAAANETAEKLQKVYDTQITEALEKL